MTLLERRAAMKAAVTLRQITMNQAAREWGVSYNYPTLVYWTDRPSFFALDAAQHQRPCRLPNHLTKRSPVHTL
jgi:hypothetical protein